MQLNKLPFALCLVASLSACVVDDGNDTDVADTGTSVTDPSTTMTTDPSTTMTTDPSTTMTTDPSTTDPSTSTDPATTDPGTSTDPGTESDPSTGVVDETGTETGTVGNCGWDVDGGYYACGFDGEDPKGNFDIECPEEPVAGGKCDKNTPINGIGCCFAGGNAFCGEDGTIQIDDSCAAG